MGVKIRLAIETDLPRITEMGAKFWAQTAYASVEYDPGSIEHWSRLMMEQQMLLVAELDGEVIGSVGAVSAPLLGNMKYIVATELFWWIEEEHRNAGLGQALLLGIEAAARQNNVKFFSMVALEQVNADHAAALYLKHGYKMTEWNFVKELT
jgi:L-amino acid N-acyltransferase YncA